MPLPPHTCIARPRKAPGTATTHVVLRGVPSLLHVHHVGVQHAVGQHLRTPRGSVPALAAPSAALPAAAMPAGAAGGSERGRTPRRRLRPVRGGGGSPHARRRPGPASTPCPQPPAKRRREGRARPRLKAAPGRRGARGARTAAPVWWGARPALRWRPLTLCGGPRGPAVSRSRPRAAARGGLGRSRVPGAIRYCSKRPKFGQQRSRQRAASRVLSAARPVPQGEWPRAEAPTYSWAAKGSEPEKRCANYPPGGLLATDLLLLSTHLRNEPHLSLVTLQEELAPQNSTCFTNHHYFALFWRQLPLKRKLGCDLPASSSLHEAIFTKLTEVSMMLVSSTK